MSNVLLFGTSLATAAPQQPRRITSEGDHRITSQGDFRAAMFVSADVIFHRLTSAGDRRLTSEGDVRITTGLEGPLYFQIDNVTSDGGLPFSLYHETNPWQPDAQGGESVFRWGFLSVSSSMSATIRVSPIVDGSADNITLPNGDVLELVRTTFTVPQVLGILERVSTVVPIPLVRRILRAGVEVGRFYLRGERLQLVIESIGALGVGEFMIDGLQVDVEPVRKAMYPAGVLSP